MTIQPNILKAFSTLVVVASSFHSAAATDAKSLPIPAGMTRVLRGAQPSGFGGGTLEAPKDWMTDTQREAIRQEIETNIELLRLAGKLSVTAINAHPQFGWPLRSAAGISDPGYHALWQFVDQDARFPDFLLDFNCGARTYDRSDGYNHQGTDFGTWPWGWRKMDRKEVEIVAAAPGQIVGRSDGNFDRSCGFNNNNWNAIYVQHADGSQALYGHMKSGSLTPKQLGDTVAEGEFLGVVGSSGNSTGPHLHFEDYNAAGQLIDPWFGACNSLNPGDPWWRSQHAYYDSAIDRMTTGDAPIDFGLCPADESPHARVAFSLGDNIFFTTYYRDQLDTQQSNHTVYRPDGSVFAEWSVTSPVPHYANSYWWSSYSVPVGEMEGTWRFTVQYLSNTYERQFTVGNPAACGSVPQTTAQGTLLQVQRISTSVRLTWGASCNPQDTDYVIYEGAIGDFANYAPFRCTTSGALAAVFTPAAGNRFYLVGPRNATREGSLGQLDNGAERPAGLSSCMTRLALQCP